MVLADSFTITDGPEPAHGVKANAGCVFGNDAGLECPDIAPTLTRVPPTRQRCDRFRQRADALRGGFDPNLERSACPFQMLRSLIQCRPYRSQGPPKYHLRPLAGRRPLELPQQWSQYRFCGANYRTVDAVANRMGECDFDVGEPGIGETGPILRLRQRTGDATDE